MNHGTTSRTAAGADDPTTAAGRHVPTRHLVTGHVATNQALIDAARAGDERAYTTIYRQYHRYALACARRRTWRADDAEHVAAEAMAKTLMALQRGGGPTRSLAGYLELAVQSALMELYRTRQRAVVAEPLDAVTESRAHWVDPRLEHGGPDDDHPVMQALAALPRRWREVVWALEVEQRPPAEVARAMGLTPNALAALKMRARRRLQHLLTHRGRPTAA